MESKDESQSAVQAASIEAVQAKLEQFQTPEIVYDEASATITYKDLHLSADHPETSKVEVTVEKHPLELAVGETYDTGLLFFDSESEKMKALASEAEDLRSLPERDRPRAVLKLLRRNIHYAYPDVLDEVEKKDPELARWVRENTGVDAPTKLVKLSDIFEKGYGICRHLSPAYLYLAQKAGLQGAMMTNALEPITNIRHADSGEKLFKSAEIGEMVGGHAWVEVRLSDGSWIPVDPSTQLVGDDDDSMEMFRKAGYSTPADVAMGAESSHNETIPQWSAPIFKPGEARAAGKFWLLLESTRPTYRLDHGEFKIHKPGTNTPYNGDAVLKVSSIPGWRKMKLSIINAAPVK